VRGRAKAVAYVEVRLDESVAGAFNLAAEAADMHVNRPGAAIEVVAPDVAQESLASAHHVTVREEEAQEFILLVG